MVIVTGTKRSGTSMWMQILIAAGFPSIGDAFPGAWERSIKAANKLGFFESKFRQGIYFATNPDPETGAYLQPKQVTRHVVKVFIPGLIRTDIAYIGPVVATMRNWREYCSSLRRLYSMEDAFRAEAKDQGEPIPQSSFPDEKVEAIIRAGQLPPALEWWVENYDLIRNIVTRGYPFHMTTYDRLLQDPEGEIGKVLKWIGDGKLDAAMKAVHPDMRTQKKNDEILNDELVSDFAEFFDEFYDRVDRSRSLDSAFIEKLNQTNTVLAARWEDNFKKRIDAIRAGVEF